MRRLSGVLNPLSTRLSYRSDKGDHKKERERRESPRWYRESTLGRRRSCNRPLLGLMQWRVESSCYAALDLLHQERMVWRDNNELGMRPLHFEPAIFITINCHNQTSDRFPVKLRRSSTVTQHLWHSAFSDFATFQFLHWLLFRVLAWNPSIASRVCRYPIRLPPSSPSSSSRFLSLSLFDSLILPVVATNTVRPSAFISTMI